MKNITRSICFVILVLLSSEFSIAQNSNYLNPASSFYANKMIFASTMVLPSQADDSVDIFIFYRLQLNQFLFTNLADEYISKYSLEFSLADSTGVIKFSKVVMDSFKLSKQISPTDSIQFQLNFIKFRINKANYTVQIRAIDNYTKNSDKSTFTLNLFDLKYKHNSFTNIVFFENNGNFFTPIILNNNLNFSGKPIEFGIFIFNGTSNNIKYEIEKKYNNPKAIDPWGNFQKQTGQIVIYPFSQLTINKTQNSIEIRFPEEASLPGPSISSIEKYGNIKFKNNIFSPGDYILKIYTSKGDTTEYKFKVIWEDEPISLLNIDYALNISKLFFNDVEMKKIEKGDYNEQFKNLIEAWEPFDPTPETPFNEAMNEFYKRVDYAYMNYSTFNEKNGAMTDKGKIYILYGPPNKIEQKFKNGKLYETWIYTSLLKEFTFETVEAGVFKIVNIKE